MLNFQLRVPQAIAKARCPEHYRERVRLFGRKPIAKFLTPRP